MGRICAISFCKLVLAQCCFSLIIMSILSLGGDKFQKKTPVSTERFTLYNIFNTLCSFMKKVPRDKAQPSPVDL